MSLLSWHESIPTDASFDVIIAGGGISGTAAALFAARRGKSVLLLEKQCWLGGLATTGLVNFWVPFCNGNGKMIIRGMAEEFLELSIRYGFDTLPEDWKNGEPLHPTKSRCQSWFSSGIFSLCLLKTLKDAGVTILYDVLISMPVMDGKHCRGLIIDGKSGRHFYEGKMIVDATGDADMLFKAGVPTIEGDNYFTYYGEGITLKGCREAIEHNDIFRAYNRPFGGAANLHGHGQPQYKLPYHGSNTHTTNCYLQENQLIMYENEKDKPRTERNIHMLPGMAQLRTARRIDGNSTLTREDCYKHCETSIGTICDFEYRDRLYEVPYGALVRNGFDNMITCGRSASASGWGWDVLRVIPPSVLTGQAAGLATALALETKSALPQLPMALLQNALAETGVIIHFDDVWVPSDVGSVNPDTSHEHI